MLNATDEQPQGRSMRELKAIMAAEDKRRGRLMDAWAELTESEQVQVVEYAEKLWDDAAEGNVAPTQEP